MSATDQKRQWVETLGAYLTECRRNTPIPHRDDLTAEEEWQCRIIGGSLIRFLNNRWPRIIRERKFLTIKFAEADPGMLVFTSAVPGLVAAAEILDPPDSRIVFLLETEWKTWSESHPDLEFRYHLHYWSYVTNVFREDEGKRIRAEFPNVLPEQLRMHRMGDMWGHLAGMGYDHLWQWDGMEMRLVKECFEEWVS